MKQFSIYQTGSFVALVLLYFAMTTRYYFPMDWDTGREVAFVFTRGVPNQIPGYSHALTQHLHAFFRIPFSYIGVDPWAGVRLMTSLFSTLSGIILFALIYSFTGHILLGLFSCALFFTFKGYIILSATADDNIWSSTFVVIFLYQVFQQIRNFKDVEQRKVGSYLNLLSLSLSLSLGVHIHQQNTLLLHLFPVLLLVSHRFRFRSILESSLIVYISFLIFSIIEIGILFSFDQWQFVLKRFYIHQYHNVPAYFIYNHPIVDWIWHVARGFTNAFYVDVFSGYAWCIFLFCLISLGSYTFLKREKSHVNQKDSYHSLLFFAVLLSWALVIPLTYEPNSLERWDNCFIVFSIILPILLDAILMNIESSLAKRVLSLSVFLFVLIISSSSLNYLYNQASQYLSTPTVRVVSKFAGDLEKNEFLAVGYQKYFIILPYLKVDPESTLQVAATFPEAVVFAVDDHQTVQFDSSFLKGEVLQVGHTLGEISFLPNCLIITTKELAILFNTSKIDSALSCKIKALF